MLVHRDRAAEKYTEAIIVKERKLLVFSASNSKGESKDCIKESNTVAN